MRQDIADFMDIQGNTINYVKEDKWVCDLAFLVNVTEYLNKLNLKLQNKENWFMNYELNGPMHAGMYAKAFCNNLGLLRYELKTTIISYSNNS